MRPHAISFAKEEKLTRDSFAAECDVNNIVAQYVKTGMINHLPRTQPQYGEAPELSFHEAASIAAELASREEEGLPLAPDEKTAPEGSQAVSEDSDSESEAPKGAAPQDSAPGESVAE